VIVDGDVQQLARLDQLRGQPEIFTTRGRLAGRVIVNEDDRGHAQHAQGRAEHLARVDERGRERARGDPVVDDQPVLGVEHQDPEVLARVVGNELRRQRRHGGRRTQRSPARARRTRLSNDPEADDVDGVVGRLRVRG